MLTTCTFEGFSAGHIQWIHTPIPLESFNLKEQRETELICMFFIFIDQNEDVKSKYLEVTNLLLQIVKVVPVTLWFSLFVRKGEIHDRCDSPESTHARDCLFNIHSPMLPQLLSHGHKSLQSML